MKNTQTESKYIDFHTHNRNKSNQHIKVINLIFTKDFSSIQELEEIVKGLDKDHFFTFGIHPWYISNISDYHLIVLEECLKKYKKHQAFLGFGEIGLDRVFSKKTMTDIEFQNQFDQQLLIFHRQLELAKEQKIKNIIIHSVRSLSDLLPILKQNTQINFILHDFSGNDTQFKQINELSNCFYSLGKMIFRQSSQNLSILKSVIIISKVFLETDDTQRDIDEIYYEFSKIIDRNIDTLKEDLATNFQNILEGK